MSVGQLTLLRHLRSKRSNGTGYRLFRPRHNITATELACHAGIVGMTARFGIINRFGYAYVVLCDGSLADGLFTQLSDSFSLA